MYEPRRLPRSQRCAVRGIECHVTRWDGGAAAPVVLLHGWMDTGATFQFLVDELPDAFRQAVWLRDVEEFSYAEIADMLNIPVGTVMSRISRGRRMLFDRLQHLNPVHA